MTTPGHQARPTPANGGLAPGTGYRHSDGAPEPAAPRHEAPEDGYGPYDTPEGTDGRYQTAGEAHGRHDTPDDAYGRHDTPDDVYGRYGAPGADDGAHGQNTASMSPPQMPGRARPRHAADPGPAGPGPAGPGPVQPGRPEPGWADPRWTEPGRAEAARAGPAWTPGRAELGRAEAAAWAGASDVVGWSPDATRPFPVVDDEPQYPEADAKQAGPANASLLRSSGVMAVGTIASRVTGFVRSAILIYAIGTHDLGNAYNLANTLPNIVYNLALGGILTSVVVPLLVNAAKRDRDRGEAYDQRIFTLGVLALGGITVVATLAAQPIATVYAGNIGSAAAYHLTVLFAYFFIPQIFFYGVSSLAGAILNARGSFAAPMWTPVINNLVVIVVGLAFMLTAGLNRTATDISASQVQLLGIGTTLGIVLQTVALIPSLRRVGFRWHPRRDFRRAEVSEIGHMSGWMFGYVLTTQVAFLVTTRVANAAGARVSQAAAGAGIAAYSNAYMLFQLPYAIVGISVITALLPRMSAHASERKYGLVSSDFSTAARLASVIVVPAALILAVLGTPLAEGVFGYGSTSIASARYVGEIFAVFSLGLLPFTLFQLLLRVFYAMHDSRTPALISVITMVINIVANLVALAVLPPQHVVAGLGAGFGLASLAGAVAAWRVMSRRIGGLDGPAIRSGLLRMHAAAIPGAIFAIAVSVMVGAIFSGGRIGALLTVAIGGSGAMLLYVLFAKAFGVAELNDLTASVRARLR
jgi:putative peptidoglycan lipid II flippase